MSYRIEYQWFGLRITSDVAPGLAEPRFVIAIEGGDNNLTTTGREGVERRVRSWDIGMIGTETQVLRQATRYGSCCEPGGLKPAGRHCTPEAYIRRIRRVMADAHAMGGSDPCLMQVSIGLGAELPASHPLVMNAPIKGFSYIPEGGYGQSWVKFQPVGPDHWATFFAALDPYLDDFSLAPHRMGQIWGLPSS